MSVIFKSTPFLAIVACWLWSTAFVGVKTGLEYHTPLQFAGIRFFLSGVLLFLWYNNPRQYKKQLLTSPGFATIIAFIQIFFQYGLFYIGLDLVPGALGAMIVGSSPLFVAMVAHFALQNERMNRLKAFSILLGVIGIVIITLGRTTVELRGEYEYLGILLLMLNNISGGFANVLILKRSKKVSPVVLSSYSLIVGGGSLFLFSLPIEGFNFGSFPTVYYFSLGWLSFLSAAAFAIWFTLIRRTGVKISELNVWKFLIPVSGALLSWILLSNEDPDIISIAGMIVIASSLLVLNYNNRKKR
ncbi:DMT family transporter [Marinilabiliaceae bacterium ANBcel2]|nr:DMT family transporter [Marinilabiliaceae bacterium ANBcel2]